MVVVSMCREALPSMGKHAQPASRVRYVAGDCPREGEEGADDVKSACPFDALGYTRDTMAETTGCKVVRRSQSYTNSAPVRIEGCNLPS